MGKNLHFFFNLLSHSLQSWHHIMEGKSLPGCSISEPTSLLMFLRRYSCSKHLGPATHIKDWNRICGVWIRPTTSYRNYLETEWSELKGNISLFFPKLGKETKRMEEGMLDWLPLEWRWICKISPCVVIHSRVKMDTNSLLHISVYTENMVFKCFNTQKYELLTGMNMFTLMGVHYTMHICKKTSQHTPNYASLFSF